MKGFNVVLTAAVGLLLTGVGVWVYTFDSRSAGSAISAPDFGERDLERVAESVTAAILEQLSEKERQRPPLERRSPQEAMSNFDQDTDAVERLTQSALVQEVILGKVLDRLSELEAYAPDAKHLPSSAELSAASLDRNWAEIESLYRTYLTEPTSVEDQLRFKTYAEVAHWLGAPTAIRGRHSKWVYQRSTGSEPELLPLLFAGGYVTEVRFGAKAGLATALNALTRE